MSDEGFSAKELVEAINKVELEEKLERIYFFVRVKGKDESFNYNIKYIKINKKSRKNFEYIKNKISRLSGKTIINECADFENRRPCYVDLDVFIRDPSTQITIQSSQPSTSSQPTEGSIIIRLIQQMEQDTPSTSKYEPENIKDTEYVSIKLDDGNGNPILIFDKFERNLMLHPKFSIFTMSTDDTYEVLEFKKYIVLRKDILFVYYKHKIIIFKLSEFEKNRSFRNFLQDYYLRKIKSSSYYNDLQSIFDDPQKLEKDLASVEPIKLRKLSKIVTDGTIKKIREKFRQEPKIVELIKNEVKKEKELKVEFDEQNIKFKIDSSDVNDVIDVITDSLAETLVLKRVVEVPE
jgi:hypothetical protein